MFVNGELAPPAYVLVTNFPYHYDLEATNTLCAILPIGFRIPDWGHNCVYGSLTDWYKAKQKHSDVELVVDSVSTYKIPSTFDGSIPEFTFGTAERRWIIGQHYDLSDYESGAAGVLTTAVVAEAETTAWLGFQLTDGRAILGQAPMSDVELAAFQRHPETFFGVPLHVGKTITKPTEWFLFFLSAHKDTPRDKMLEFFAKSCNLDQLEKLPDDELRYYFCERQTMAVMQKATTRHQAPDVGGS